MQKTVFITCFHPLTTRNILNAGVLDLILRADIRVVLLVPPSKVDYYRNVFSPKGVLVEGVTIPKHPLEELFTFISYCAVNIENHIVRGWKREVFGIKYHLAHILHPVVSRIPFARRFLRALGAKLFVTPALDLLIQQYGPSLLFTTDSFYREDRTLLNVARANRIPTVGMIRSWDNATTKGVFLCDPDHIIVVNEVLKDELVTLHGVESSRISITGWPHYDTVQLPPTVTRADFLTQFNLHPKNPVVLICPGGKILYRHDRELLGVFKSLLDTGKVPRNTQFLVRFPPADVVDTTEIDGDTRFAIDKPGTNVTGRKKESELSVEDNVHLENTLKHVDVVVTLVSTMTLDAAIFDKPVVVFGFDPIVAPEQSVSTMAAYPHFGKLLRTGYVKVATNEVELGEFITEYLKNPGLDSRLRQELTQRYAFKIGGSAERVAAVVLSALQSN